MNFHFMVRSFVGSVFVSLFFSSAASAELESYGFLLAVPQRKPQLAVQTASYKNKFKNLSLTALQIFIKLNNNT